MNVDSSRVRFLFKILMAVLLLALIVFIVFGSHALSRDTLHEIAFGDNQIATYIHAHKVISINAFILVFSVASALTLPFESALCILAGYFFGPVLGTLIAIFSATLGATVNIVIIRTYLKNRFKRFAESKNVARVLEAIGKDPFSSVLFLRLVPLFPHFITNFALALSPVRVRDYTIATAIGTFPQLTIFVFAGTQFATIRDTGEILAPESIGVMVLLGVFSILPTVWKRLRRGLPPTTTET